MYGELRLMDFTPTKAHEAFRSALEGFRDSLAQFGHSPLKLMYTDNVADAPFLQSIFPSLSEDVHPVDPYSHLPLLAFPHEEVDIVIASTAKDCDDVIRALMFDGKEGDHLPADFRLVVALDFEWNVDMSGPRGSASAGKTAVMQIAYEKQVYILQVCRHTCYCLLSLNFITDISLHACQEVTSTLGALSLKCPSNQNRALHQCRSEAFRTGGLAGTSVCRES